MENKRNLSIDLVKMVAMCCVMCLHTQYNYSSESLLAHILYTSAVVAIPLFFMTSGYLLFGKEQTGYQYVVRKIIGILRFVFIITVCWWLFFGIRHDESFLVATFGSFFQKGGMNVFWYFGAMIIIYALLPALNNLYKNRISLFYLLTVCLLIICSIVFTLNITHGTHIEQHTIQTFRIWDWLLYFNLGGILKRFKFHVNFCIVLFMFVANYIFQTGTIPYMTTKYCEYFYPSIVVVLLSVALFTYLKGIDDRMLKFVSGGGVKYSCLATRCIVTL